MDRSNVAEVYPKLFEFIEREKFGLMPKLFSTKKGVLLAGEDLLRAAGHLPGSKRPKGWREAADGFGRRARDGKYTLRAIKRGDRKHGPTDRGVPTPYQTRSVHRSTQLRISFACFGTSVSWPKAEGEWLPTCQLGMRSSQCARQVQSVHTRASYPACIFQAA
jgi:hypothetical protein